MWLDEMGSMVYPLIMMFIIFFYIIYRLTNRLNVNRKEGFSVSDTSTLITPYHEEYVKFYDKYLFDEKRFNMEIKNIENLLKKSNEYYQIKILDVGSGTGDHVKKLKDKGYDVMGIDSSLPMIEFARDKHKLSEDIFKHADGLTSSLFDFGVFTHIICLNYTFYYIKDKRRFLENCYGWLMDGGYMLITMVDEIEVNSFDSGGNIVLDDLEYSTNYKKRNKNTIVFKERVRKLNDEYRNEHILYGIGDVSIRDMWRDIGFKDVKRISLKKVEYPYHTIYVLKKEL